MVDPNVNSQHEGATANYSDKQQEAYQEAYRRALQSAGTTAAQPSQQPVGASAQPSQQSVITQATSPAKPAASVQPTTPLPATASAYQAPATQQAGSYARPTAGVQQPTQPATTQQMPAAQQAAPAQPTYQAQPVYPQQSYASSAQQPYVAGAAHAQTDTKAARKAAKAAAKANKSGGGGFKTFALGFLGAACAFAIGAGVLGANGFFNKPTVTETVSEGGTVVLGSESNTTVAAVENNPEGLAEAVADKVLPSIVGIDVYSDFSSGYSTFWGGGSTDSESLAGLGSGVIISTDGYILTNYHVVEGASKLMVTVSGEEMEATVVGTDESSDLAVIKVNGTDLSPVEIGSSDNLKPGQWVMTLGSPFGLEQSVATGIISATSRTVVIQNTDSLYSYGQQVQPSIYSNMIQTDAAINPGNSGGALVDANGKLIGINSVIESYSGSYSGVGFAIPVDYAMNIATQIIDGKTPTHAQLGVSATTVSRDIAERYNLGVTSGAYINKVYDESGAQAAGLEQGDIITKFAGVAIESSTDLIAQTRAHNVGETVTLTIVRNGETMEVEVTLGSDENTASLSEEPNSNSNSSGQGQNGSSEGGNGFNFNFGQGENGSNGFTYEDLQELLDQFRR